MKAFALMGVGLEALGGQVTVTDMDTIELSNLNRQFLFRNRDLGKRKSEVAARAAKAMNAGIKVIAMDTPVGADTEVCVGGARGSPASRLVVRYGCRCALPVLLCAACVVCTLVGATVARRCLRLVARASCARRPVLTAEVVSRVRLGAHL